MSELNVNYEPKSITGLLVVAGIVFVGIGSITGNADMTEYGNLFLLPGLGSWFHFIDKNNQKPVNKRLPVRKIKR
ncbi:hypothetical protein [uncultured Methanolobus sp.]|uniref:hypothetical protein n=1 Tax=uncultured Methanolobus sp. TaxID=218300 RepID=UPI002AAB41FA|nr:hypothetical protein [uncultured Methanolobus sp.]